MLCYLRTRSNLSLPMNLQQFQRLHQIRLCSIKIWTKSFQQKISRKHILLQHQQLQYLRICSQQWLICFDKKQRVHHLASCSSQRLRFLSVPLSYIQIGIQRSHFMRNYYLWPRSQRMQYQ
ncbi:hypothetical protein FGO68_gene7465 [Halteria grandinella]|uniref:Uncharacterized protein n=1 Tax=Halteria grandinella TaxID=5974 RepID=A0A8J8TAV9_HALGN|nr:hypothetical protein FGO68_gene7465 [Halteria grandinella]